MQTQKPCWRHYTYDLQIPLLHPFPSFTPVLLHWPLPAPLPYPNRFRLGSCFYFSCTPDALIYSLLHAVRHCHFASISGLLAVFCVQLHWAPLPLTFIDYGQTSLKRDILIQKHFDQNFGKEHGIRLRKPYMPDLRAFLANQLCAPLWSLATFLLLPPALVTSSLLDCDLSCDNNYSCVGEKMLWCD